MQRFERTQPAFQAFDLLQETSPRVGRSTQQAFGATRDKFTTHEESRLVTETLQMRRWYGQGASPDTGRALRPVQSCQSAQNLYCERGKAIAGGDKFPDLPSCGGVTGLGDRTVAQLMRGVHRSYHESSLLEK